MTEIYNNLLETEKSINSINQVQDQDILSKIKINNRKGMNNSKSMDNTECIQSSIDYTGIKAEVVINYKDAIEKLTRPGTYKKDCYNSHH